MDHAHDEAAAEAAAEEKQAGDAPTAEEQQEESAAAQLIVVDDGEVSEANNEPDAATLAIEPQQEVKDDVAEEPALDLAELPKHIEAIVFASEQPVAVIDITDALNRAHGLALDINVVRNHLESLLDKYQDDVYPFGMVESGGGYRFMSKDAYHETISHFLNLKSKRRLSTAAMETLAIIAYRQPVTKSEVENIRGVNCDYSVQKLLEKELVEITGRADTPGKPLLYGTSGAFMDYFGINSVEELPKLKEFEQQGDVMGISPEALDAEGAILPAMPSEPAVAEAEQPEQSSDTLLADAAEAGSGEPETAMEADPAIDQAVSDEEADPDMDQTEFNEETDEESDPDMDQTASNEEADPDMDQTASDEEADPDDDVQPDNADETDPLQA